MKKNWLVVVFIISLTTPALSQTLFTYGPYKAEASEFLRAFNKNNQQPGGNKTVAMREYLNLYVNSRLKIREAYDRGYDSLPQIKSEVENLRNQIIENYMSDPQAIDRLTKEAFQRSLKDIHAAHIFIADDMSTDSTAMLNKLNEVQKRLARGEDFLAVAYQFSDDPSAKDNKGDMNYITVFTLPYEFENVIYSTAPGKYSKPYRSKAGYHIFKNLGERKGLGKIKIQHLLVGFPPGIDDAGKKERQQLADSLYQRILAGDDFENLANVFSNDLIGASSGGRLPDIVVGQYEPVFEKTIWALPKNGAVSKPFLTSHGYHIVKRLETTPVVTNAANKTNMDELKQKVTMDDRWTTSKDFIYTRIKNKGSFQQSPYNSATLWAFSDSVLDAKPLTIKHNLTYQTPVFKLGSTTFTIADWITYAQSNRYRLNRGGVKPYNALMDEFIKSSMYRYYQDHLEDFNADFRSQMTEFRDGNLFFEIMQQEVWNKAQADSTALIKLYQQNKTHYNWQPSADAIIFFCADETTAKTLSGQIKKNTTDWKKLADAMNEKVVADSGRYEWQQLPGLQKTTPQPGIITSPVINPSDKTASFAYIIKTYTQPAPRSFPEAKGLVMNDYQILLEEEWIKSLKKKYPVVIDEKVLANISK
jgi:peptidyl-prolyl cis-trans isomerase SurA